MRHSSLISNVSSQDLISSLIHPSVLDVCGIAFGSGNFFEYENLSKDVLTLKMEGEHGSIVVSNDGLRVVIEAYTAGKMILKAAIRDRQLDGTDKTSPLTAFPNSDPACNRLPHPQFRACELSIYSYSPADTFADSCENGSLPHFVSDPDHYIWRQFDADKFFPLFQEALSSGRGPWQKSLPMSGVPSYFVKQSEILLKSIDYHRVDCVPSWFNVARFFEKMKYGFTYGEHLQTYRAIGRSLKRNFCHLSLVQQSWIVALQNIPEVYLPEKWRLKARWPVTHTNSYWVRMHKELNRFSPPKTYSVPNSLSQILQS